MVVLIGYQTFDVARSDYGMDKAEIGLEKKADGLEEKPFCGGSCREHRVRSTLFPEN